MLESIYNFRDVRDFSYFFLFHFDFEFLVRMVHVDVLKLGTHYAIQKIHKKIHRQNSAGPDQTASEEAV